TNFAVAAPSREGYAGSQPWCAKCRTHHHEKANCLTKEHVTSVVTRESGQSRNQLALGWRRNDRGGGNQVRGRAYNRKHECGRGCQGFKRCHGYFFSKRSICYCSV
ncbi:hypothetical protein Tco_0330326, partial [Tanacetum coccineum]